MGRRGYCIPEVVLRSIIQLLSTTDLPVKQIAQKTFCEPNIVASVNRRFQIRGLTLNRDRGLKQAETPDPPPEGIQLS